MHVSGVGGNSKTFKRFLRDRFCFSPAPATSCSLIKQGINSENDVLEWFEKISKVVNPYQAGQEKTMMDYECRMMTIALSYSGQCPKS